MCELVILDLTTNKKFSKIFENEYLKNKFKSKCKYSKKLKIIAEFTI